MNNNEEWLSGKYTERNLGITKRHFWDCDLSFMANIWLFFIYFGHAHCSILWLENIWTKRAIRWSTAVFYFLLLLLLGDIHKRRPPFCVARKSCISESMKVSLMFTRNYNSNRPNCKSPIKLLTGLNNRHGLHINKWKWKTPPSSWTEPPTARFFN